MQNAADIIAVFLIDGDFGVTGFAYFGDDLFQWHIHGQKKDIGTGCHDIFQGLVAKIKYLFDKLGFKMIQSSFTDGLPGEDSDHIFGNNIAARTFLADNQRYEPIGNFADNQSQGFYDPGKPLNGPALKAGEGDVVTDSENFRRDFPQ